MSQAAATVCISVGGHCSQRFSLVLVLAQVKVAILKYIESLARQMDPADFVNSSETRLAVSRIITWTTEPKSSDVRKVSGARKRVNGFYSTELLPRLCEGAVCPQTH